MKIVCAWCRREGRDAVIAEREPAEDAVETHTICPRHSDQLMAQLPSLSFPGVRVLLVVRRTETMLFQHLARSFVGLSDIAVIVDRRMHERRQARARVANDRRHVNRRVRLAQFSNLGYLVVRFGAERASDAMVPPTPKTGRP